MPTPLSQVTDAAYDVLLGASCAGCGAAGRPWCRSCAEVLARQVRAVRPLPAAPSPCPAGLPPVWTAGAYDAGWRTAVLAYKERGRRRLARPLGRALAVPLLRVVAGRPDVRCVPLPASRAARATRGYDHVGLLVRQALATPGVPRPVSLLRWVRPSADQVGLDAEARRHNRHGALVARPCGGLLVVLVDDVVTTGATLAEATRALVAAGAQVLGAATVAATVRRVQPFVGAPPHRLEGG